MCSLLVGMKSSGRGAEQPREREPDLLEAAEEAARGKALVPMRARAAKAAWLPEQARRPSGIKRPQP